MWGGGTLGSMCNCVCESVELVYLWAHISKIVSLLHLTNHPPPEIGNSMTTCLGTFCVTLFNDDLSNEPNFGRIHLAGHWTVSLTNHPLKIGNLKTTCPGSLFYSLWWKWAQLLKNTLFFFARTYRSSGLLYHAQGIQGPLPHSLAHGIQGPLPHSLTIYSKLIYNIQKYVLAVYTGMSYTFFM